MKLTPTTEQHNRLAHAITRAADALCAAMFAIVFIVFCYKIFRRYTSHDVVAWGEELTVVLFVWIIFIANAFVVEEKKQISFDLIHRNLSPRAQKWVEVARLLLVGGIFAAALPVAFDYILFLWRERTPVLLWRFDILYMCFAIFMAAMIVRMACRLLTLLTQSTPRET